MIGIIDTNALYPVRFGDKSLFCHVAPIPAGQAAKIVVQYLREHPTRLQERGGGFAIEALQAAFCCPRSQP
jgi:hypothetical protein